MNKDHDQQRHRPSHDDEYPRKDEATNTEAPIGEKEPRSRRDRAHAGMARPHRERLLSPAISALHAQRMTDQEMAFALGVTPAAVTAMRASLGLAPHTRLSTDRRRRAKLVEGYEDGYRYYYDLGLFDVEIGRRLGVTRSAVYEWRKRNRLPCHKRHPASADCWRYYIRGFSDKEISLQTGVKEGTVRHWRYRYDLPAPSRFRVETDAGGRAVVVARGVPDYRKYYDQGWNDAEIAAVVNRKQSAVQTWRRKNNLPPNVIGSPTRAGTFLPVKDRQPRHIVAPVVTKPDRPVRRRRQERRAGARAEQQG